MFALGQGCGQHPAEGDVHSLHAVRQGKEPRSFAREFLENRATGKREPALAGELVEQIPDSDVERLPEDPIAASGECDHLRVAAAHVKEDGILRVRDPAPDLKVSDAVVDAENRHVETERERTCGRRDRPEARPEPRPLRERDQVEVMQLDPRNPRRLRDQRDDELRMMVRRLARMDATLLRPEHVVHVREDPAVLVNDPHADRVRGPFDAEGEHSAR